MINASLDAYTEGDRHKQSYPGELGTVGNGWQQWPLSMHRRVAGSLAVTGAYGNPQEARGLGESLWNVGGVCVCRKVQS